MMYKVNQNISDDVVPDSKPWTAIIILSWWLEYKPIGYYFWNSNTGS